jgi:TRAP-type C4-dicarboxylate transport system substrate-binding protein
MRDVQAKDRAEFEQTSQIQKERIEELERLLNRRSGSQLEVSVAPSGHERGSMGDDGAVASNVRDSNISGDDLERGSMKEVDGNHQQGSDSIKGKYSIYNGSNIYNA